MTETTTRAGQGGPFGAIVLRSRRTESDLELFEP